MEKSLFFDGGQEYSAADWALYFRGLASSGVNAFGNLDSLKVVKDAAMTAKVSNGKALINGYYYEAYNNDTLLALAPTTGEARIDRIVLRLNLNQNEWSITAQVKQGTATTPPALQRDNNIYELSLATITIPAGQSTLTNATVTDDRADGAVCGMLSFLGQQPYYPTGSVPPELWLYTIFPGELTAGEKATLEANPTLMAKWNASRLSGYYNFQPKRNAVGAIEYVLEGQDNTERVHNIAPINLRSSSNPGIFTTYEQDLSSVTVEPSHRKRFLKIAYTTKRDIQYSSTYASATEEILLIIDGSTVLKTIIAPWMGGYGMGEYTGSVVIPAGTSKTIKLRSKIVYEYGNFTTLANYAKDFKIYMEDME